MSRHDTQVIFASILTIVGVICIATDGVWWLIVGCVLMSFGLPLLVRAGQEQP